MLTKKQQNKIQSKFDEINEIATTLDYLRCRDIQELLCDCLEILDISESEHPELLRFPTKNTKGVETMKNLVSKSETIGVQEIRKLRELADVLDLALTPDEYILLISIYNRVINRLLKENNLTNIDIYNICSYKFLTIDE